MRPRSPDTTFALIAPGLLILVALVQLVRAHAWDLQPWKGGGFGMFAVVEDRFLRAHLVSDDREVVVGVGDLDFGMSNHTEVTFVPSRAALTTIADRIAAQAWVLDATAEPAERAAAIPDSARARIYRKDYLRRLHGELPLPDSLARYRPRVVPHLARPYVTGDPDSLRIDFNAVRVELWRLNYDGTTSRVTAEPMLAVTIPHTPTDG